MKQRFRKLIVLSMTLAICACAGVQAGAPVGTTAKTPVSEKDNFYMAVNQKILATHQIKPTMPAWSQFGEIDDNNRKLISKDIQQIVAKRGTYKKGTPEQKIADLYQCIMDKKTRDSTAPAAIRKMLEPIRDAKTTDDLVKAFNTEYKLYGIDGLAGFAVERLPSSPIYSVRIEPTVPMLPQNLLLQEAKPGEWQSYENYIAGVLAWDGQAPAEAAKNAKAIVTWEQKMAPYLLSGQEKNDVSNISRTIPAPELKKIMTNLQGAALMKNWGIDKQETIVLAERKYLEQLDKEFTNANVPFFKNYFIFRTISGLSSAGPIALRDKALQFDNSLEGIKEQFSDKELAERMVMGSLPYEVGEIYQHKYCPAETVTDVKNMIKSIQAIYRDRLSHNTWLSAATRQKAIEKVDALRIFVGGPAANDLPLVESMPSVVPESEGGTLLSNMIENGKLRDAQYAKLIGTKFNPDKWEGMDPFTVNACYNPEANSMVIPAGILWKPFYDAKSDYGTKLGGIAVVIGHELSHAFDTNGCRFDKDGLMKNWWTKEDYAVFQKKAEKFYPYYAAYTLRGNRHMNGQLVSTEAIADCGGVSVVTQMAGGDRQVLRNLYRNFAVIFADKMTDEFLNDILNNNPHPVLDGRVNRVLSSTPGFYDAYDIKPGDGMYVAPENRVALW